MFICSRRYELRVRYLPRSFHDLMAKDTETFYYFYEQVRYGGYSHRSYVQF